MVFKRQQQAGAMQAYDFLPMKAAQCPFDGPEQVQASVDAGLPDLGVGRDGAELAQLGHAANACLHQHGLRFRAEVGQV